MAIRTDLNNKNYHAEKGLSASGLKEFLISPAHYVEYKSRAFDDSVKLESLIHLFLLEPQSFDSQFAIVGDRRTKEGKLAYENAIKDGKLVVKEDDVSHAQMVATNVLSNPKLEGLFKSFKNEASVFNVDPHLGIQLKVRPDILNEEQGIVYDVKTISRGMSKYGIQSLVRARGWDIQAAFYLYVLEQEFNKKFDFIHIFVEKDAPFGVRLMRINSKSIDNALKDILPALADYKKCLDNENFPSFDADKIEDINVFRFDNSDWSEV